MLEKCLFVGFAAFGPVFTILGVLGPTKWVRGCVPQRTVNHSESYADFLGHHTSGSLWYYCTRKRRMCPPSEHNQLE